MFCQENLFIYFQSMQPLWQLLSAELSNVYTVNIVCNTALLIDDCILASQGMKSLFVICV